MRWVQGIWELLASIGLLWPRMRWAGGILTTGAMAAAIFESHDVAGLFHPRRSWAAVRYGNHNLLLRADGIDAPSRIHP